MIEFGFAILISIVLLGIGYPVAARLGGGDRLTFLEISLVAVLVGSLICFYAIWIVGAVAFSRGSMGILTAVLAGVACPGLWAWRGRLGRHVDFGFLRGREGRVFAGLFLLLFLVLLIDCLAPPADGDAVRYHLLLPKRDLELGAIRAIYGWSTYDFFPALMEMLFRWGLAVAGPRTAQFIHSLFALVAALATWAMSRRVGLSKNDALVAAVLFLSIRVVMYQSATADIDQAVTASFAVLVVLVLASRENPCMDLAVLMGLMGGCLLNIKYNGIVLIFIISVVIVINILVSRRSISSFLIFCIVLMLCFVPLLSRNFIETGNPIFPLYNNLFGPERIDLLDGTRESYARLYGLAGFLVMPFAIFVSPNTFDGLQFGSAMLLVFMPFAWLGRYRLKHAGLLVAVMTAFMAAWFFVMPQQVRFLQPVFPIFALFGAVGARVMFKLVKPYPVLRAGLALLVGLLVLNQALFFGGTSVRRLPVALGLLSDERYLTSAPYLGSTHVEACRFLTAHLKPGERYLVLLNSPSFYCPQGPMAMQVLPSDYDRIYTRLPLDPVDAMQVVRFLERNEVRWIIDDLADEEPFPFQKYDFFRDRFADVLVPALTRETPYLTTATARIYSVAGIMKRLHQANAEKAAR